MSLPSAPISSMTAESVIEQRRNLSSTGFTSLLTSVHFWLQWWWSTCKTRDCGGSPLPSQVRGRFPCIYDHKTDVTGGVMLLSALTFFWRKSLYRCIPPSESPVVRFFATVCRALRDQPKRFSYSAVDRPSGEEMRSRNHRQQQHTHWLDCATASGILIINTRSSGQLPSYRKIFAPRCARSEARVPNAPHLCHRRVFLVAPYKCVTFSIVHVFCVVLS